jgi:hypothetical protein
MAVRLVNPFWKSAAQQKAEQHAPAVQAWLQANAGNRLVTLAELKAGLPAAAPDLSRAVFNQICAQLGVVIDNPDDTDA